MRILLSMPSLTGTGGAERMVDGLSRLLSSAGVGVCAIGWKRL
jgi:hypothetical protein